MKPDAKKVTTMTTAAACHNSFQVGQVTFLSSCCVSRKKFVAFCTITSSRSIESLISRPYKTGLAGLGALRFRFGSAIRPFEHDMLSCSTAGTPFALCQNSLKKQAWQDSNLQHAVLETAALPIGATGLCPVWLRKLTSSP